MLPLTSILATTGLFSLIMLLVLASLMRSGVAGVREWCLANSMVVLAVVQLGLRGVISDFLSIVVANTMLSLAGAFYYAGCARFLDRRPYWPRLLAGVAAVCIAMIIWRYARNDIIARVLVFSTFNTIMCVALGLLFQRQRQDRHHLFLLGASLGWIFALLQVIRALGFAYMPLDTEITMLSHPWHLGLLTFSAMSMPTLSMLAIMMTHDTMLSKMEEAINHDHLTATLSRKRFECLAMDALQGAVPSQPVSLLLIDLDHFKQINDTWGHAAGDHVLRAFASMAMTLTRPGDALGRLGGEEFGLLLPHTASSDAIAVAERLRHMAEEQIVQGPFGSCRYSISVGVTTTTLHESLDHLFARADRALYRAKNHGRNQVLNDEMVSVAMPQTAQKTAT